MSSQITPLAGEIDAVVETFRPELLEVSAALHAEPEIRFEEVRAAARLTESLERHGFAVQRGFADLPTAFVARWSTPAAEVAAVKGAEVPTVAIFCEYDALEEIGHACGHNLIAAAGLGAGLATKAWLEAHSEVSARLVVIGSPGEEGAAGKVPMIDGGVLDGIGAAIMVHPAGVDRVWVQTLSRVAWNVQFTGRASHAASDPDGGINALDAVTLLMTAIGLARQQLPDDVRIHGIVLDGGQAPNIIPERTEYRVFIRAADAGTLYETVLPKIRACVEGAAIATGCGFEICERTPAYESMRTNDPLAEVAAEVFGWQGRTVVADDSPSGLGSTDMGNVSQRVPAIHPMICLEPDAVPHTREFAASAGAAPGERVVSDGATMLATVAVAAFTDPELLRRATNAFTKRSED